MNSLKKESINIMPSSLFNNFKEKKTAIQIRKFYFNKIKKLIKLIMKK